MDIVLQLLSNLRVPAIYGLICLPIPMILGMLWYGPLFGKPWMRAVGKTQDELTMGFGLILGTAVAWFLSTWMSGLGIYMFTYSPLGQFLIGSDMKPVFVVVAMVFATFAYVGYGLNHIIMAKNYQGQPYSLAFIDFGYQYTGFVLIAIAQALIAYSGFMMPAAA